MKDSIRKRAVEFSILACISMSLTPINAVKQSTIGVYDAIICKRIMVDDGKGNLIFLGSAEEAVRHIPFLKGNPEDSGFGIYVINSNNTSVGFYLSNEVYLLGKAKTTMGMASLGVKPESGGGLALTNGEGKSMAGVIATEGRYGFMARSRKGGAAVIGIHSETEGGHILLTTSDGTRQVFSKGEPD